MAVTIARVSGGRKVAGNSIGRYVDITGPASYTTGGETLSAADIKSLTHESGLIGDIKGFLAEETSGGHTLYLDRTNSKVQYFNGTTEIVSTTNLSTFKARVYVERIVNG